jgi:hypothetical protein
MNMETLDIEQFRELLKDYEVNRWKITDAKMNAWERLDTVCPRELTTDCAVNVVTFLNLLDRNTAKIISRDLNVRQKGVDFGAIIPYIYEDVIRREYVKTNHVYNIFKMNAPVFELLIHHLGKGYAMILELLYTSGNNSTKGHAVVLGVTDNGDPILIDPQQETYSRGWETIHTYMNSGKIFGFGAYLRLKRTKRFKNETSERVRKPSPEQHTRKRRRIGSPVPPPPAREASESVDRSDTESTGPAKNKRTKKRGKSKGKSQKRSQSRSASRSQQQRSLSPIREEKEEGEVSDHEDSLSYPTDVSPAYQPVPKKSKSRSPSGPEYDPVGLAEPEPEPLPVPLAVPLPSTRATRSSARKK